MIQQRPMGFLGLALVFLSLGACTTAGVYKRDLASRPLTVGEGDDQLAMTFVTRYSKSQESVTEPLSITYRWGITERLNLEVPARLGYRFGDASETQFYVGGGFDGLGSGIGESAFSGDPRVPPKSYRTRIFLPGVSSAVKVLLQERVAWMASFRLTYQGEYPRNVNQRTSLSFTNSLIADFNAYLSFSLSMGASWSSEHLNDDGEVGTQQAFHLGGGGSDGYATIPMFSVHLSDVFDLGFSPLLSFNLKNGEMSYSGIAGLDWHWH